MKLKANYIGEGNTLFQPGTLYSYQFYCPGCNCLHSYVVASWKDPEGNQHTGWRFDGNLESPTFSPSLLIFYTHPQTKQRVSICHVVLTNGILNFCHDCEHELKGKSVPLPEIPEHLSDRKEG